MNKGKAALAATAGAILTVVMAAAPAQAQAESAAPVSVLGNCTYPGLGQELCGRVVNSSSSEKWLVVADNWNCGGSGTACGEKVRLYPSDESTDHYKDADGVYIPNGCHGDNGGQDYPGGKWTKIRDNFGYYTIKVTC